MSAGSWQYYGTTATGESKIIFLDIVSFCACVCVCMHLYVCVHVSMYVCVHRWLCSFLIPHVVYVSKGGSVCVYVH